MRIPKWIREINCFSNIKNCLILEGNIYDEYPVFDENMEVCEDFCDLNTYIYEYFNKKGYKVCFYDMINGFYNRQKQLELVDIFESIVDIIDDEEFKHQFEEYKKDSETTRTDGQISNNIAIEILESSEIIKNTLIENSVSTVFCMNYASRVLAEPNHMSEQERAVFTNLLYSVMNAKSNFCEDGITRQNILILIVDKINDIPTWFYIDNPYIKNIVIASPDKHIRKMYVEYYKDKFIDSDEDADNIINHFADITDGMKVLDLRGIRELKKLQNMDYSHLNDVVALYKYGIKENPWDEIEREKLENNRIKERVKGQDIAVDKSIAVIKRAKTGFSGLQHSSTTKPKGILFFAGPTGGCELVV